MENYVYAIDQVYKILNKKMDTFICPPPLSPPVWTLKCFRTTCISEFLVTLGWFLISLNSHGIWRKIHLTLAAIIWSGSNYMDFPSINPFNITIIWECLVALDTVWIVVWLLRELLSMNILSHWLHWYGLSPVCAFICLRR